MTPALYAAILAIKQTIVAAYTAQDMWLDPRNEGPNPFYHQTATGLILATYYSTFHTLYTPLGYIDLFGSSSSTHSQTERANAVITSALGLECIRESKNVEMGPTPALYTIARVEGHTLPAHTPRAHEDFVEYATAKARWAELVAG